jgi:OTU domain-containing protein 5
MKYILANKAFFQAFIAGESAEEYCVRKSKDRVWGDDVELQALSEIYDRAIEIYAYQTESMRTFHEQEKARKPIRLSYHGSSHYNSVVKLGWTLSDALLQS